MTQLTDEERGLLIQRVLDAHHFIAGKTVNPQTIRAIAADLRTEFTQAGARWDELALLVVQFLDSWRLHPRLTTKQHAESVNAFRQGFGLTSGGKPLSRGDRRDMKWARK